MPTVRHQGRALTDAFITKHVTHTETYYVPVGFRKSYIVPIPKPKDCRSKSMKYDDFRGITISPVISKKF